jgi:hypothetical protein
MYRVPRHIWRTTDGELVSHGHPKAAFLAYAAGDELTDHDAQAKGVLTVYPEKARRKPADKAMPKPADKSGDQSTDTKE